MIRAYLGLGTNLGDRRGMLEQALSLLGARPDVQLRRVSSLYETEPVDVAGGWFFNGVVETETSLSPLELLEIVLQVEEACGRP
ncbi:MAG: 2-amino-4-hydroxy-6-hydroxymethyldihydropteridine diphosphokinase, partial [Candidatus Methylomirabilales bacterium]